MDHGLRIETVLRDDFERVLVARDPESDLHAVIAIHDTTLGPALGGVRMVPYPNQGAALDDCCRLARAMTLKAAVAGLDLGAGGASSSAIRPSTARRSDCSPMAGSSHRWAEASSRSTMSAPDRTTSP